ncbi:hypothetical protein FACS1894133_5600 [Clostridia bacterium]|nr:hypothetical protein FACS1894133_5600 [Clostridia bacterium]
MPNYNRTKRRSKGNLGVYLIAFAVTAVALTLVVLLLWNRFMQPSPGQNAVSTGDDRPDVSLDMNVLFLLSESKGGTPEQFLLMNYRPHDNKMLAVPLRPNTLAKSGGTLTDLYRSGGAPRLARGVGETLGIECKYYIKFDKSSFVEFISLLGDVPVDVSKDVVAGGDGAVTVAGGSDGAVTTAGSSGDSDGTGGVGGSGGSVFSAGTYSLSADKLYDYLTIRGDGGDDKYNAQGSAAVSIINNCSRNLTVQTLTNMFTVIRNGADANFTFDDYTNYQKVFLYTTTRIFDSASFYLPYGDTDENGNFVIASQSAAIVQTRFRADGV